MEHNTNVDKNTKHRRMIRCKNKQLLEKTQEKLLKMKKVVAVVENEETAQFVRKNMPRVDVILLLEQ